MSPNKAFNGAHKRNLGGLRREKAARRARGAIPHNGVNVTAERDDICGGTHKGSWWEGGGASGPPLPASDGGSFRGERRRRGSAPSIARLIRG